MTVPPGTYGRIAPRSSLALKHHIYISAGVIDRDYTGPVGILMVNHGSQDFKVNLGDRIAQLILERIADEPIIITQELTDTIRGDGGFGSTGAKQINIILEKQKNSIKYNNPNQGTYGTDDLDDKGTVDNNLCYQIPDLCNKGDSRAHHTGDKGQCTEPVHCKDTARKWIMYWACADPVHPKYIQNFPGKFPSSPQPRKWLVHSQCPESCDYNVPIGKLMGTS